MSEWIRKVIQPILDAEYEKGFRAGVYAESLKEKKELTDREHYLFTYGYKQGKADAMAENGLIEEISAEEFERLTRESAEPTTRTEIPEGFGFVGTVDDISLVLDEEAV